MIEIVNLRGLFTKILLNFKSIADFIFLNLLVLNLFLLSFSDTPNKLVRLLLLSISLSILVRCRW